MSRANDKSPDNGPWWKVLVLALIFAATLVAVTLINRYGSIDADRPAGETPVDAVKPPQTQASALKITNLQPGGQVEPNPIVEGEASGPVDQVWLLIQTSEMPPKCWAQGPAGVDENRTWRIPAQFGRSRSLDSGARFSVSAIAVRPNEISAGLVSCTLVPAVRSPSIEVTRQ